MTGVVFTNWKIPLRKHNRSSTLKNRSSNLCREIYIHKPLHPTYLQSPLTSTHSYSLGTADFYLLSLYSILCLLFKAKRLLPSIFLFLLWRWHFISHITEVTTVKDKKWNDFDTQCSTAISRDVLKLQHKLGNN